MRIRNGWPVFAGVVFLVIAGCNTRDEDQFQQYSADDSTKSQSEQTSKPQKPKFNAAQAKLNKIAAKTPKVLGDWTEGMPAAVGFAGGVVFSDTFKLSGEQWLTPALGAGPTIVLVKNASGKTAVSVKKPREVKILVKEKTFRTEGPEGAIRVSYDDIDLLKVINMDPVTPDAPEKMPDWLKGLDGKRVRIRGFMSPAFRQTGLAGFLMGRDNKACCFPGTAKIYDLFPVRMRKGVTTDYIQNRPFDVVGTFEIKTWVEGDELLQIYQITDAIVIQ